jgi:hypothetical protein
MTKLVMPGLVPGIHVLACLSKKDVDGRDQPGHDEKNDSFQRGESVSKPSANFSYTGVSSNA